MEQSIQKFRGEYFFLSNFYECPVTYKQLTYANNEAEPVRSEKTGQTSKSEKRLGSCQSENYGGAY